MYIHNKIKKYIGDSIRLFIHTQKIISFKNICDIAEQKGSTWVYVIYKACNLYGAIIMVQITHFHSNSGTPKRTLLLGEVTNV